MVDDTQKPTSGAATSVMWLVAGVGLVGLTLVDQRGLIFPRRNAPPVAMIASVEGAGAPAATYAVRPTGLFRAHSPRIGGAAAGPRLAATPFVSPAEPGEAILIAPPPPFEEIATAGIGGPAGDDAGAGGSNGGFQPIGFNGGGGGVGSGGGGGGGVIDETPQEPPVTNPPVTNPPVVNPPVTNPPTGEPPIDPPVNPPVTPVPEPGLWLVMIGGVAMVGGALRRRRFSQARGRLQRS